MSNGGSTSSSSKLVVIRRSNGTVQEVARQRVRQHHVPNLLQLSAIDLRKLSPELKAILSEGSESEGGTKKKQVPKTKVQKYKTKKKAKAYKISSDSDSDSEKSSKDEYKTAFVSFVQQQERSMYLQEAFVSNLDERLQKIGDKQTRRRKRKEEEPDVEHDSPVETPPKLAAEMRVPPKTSTKLSKQHQCIQCMKRFASGNELFEHLRTEHNIDTETQGLDRGRKLVEERIEERKRSSTPKRSSSVPASPGKRQSSYGPMPWKSK